MKFICTILLLSVAATAETPKLTDGDKLQIRNLQVEIQSLLLNASSLEAQANQIRSQQIPAKNAQLQDALKKIYDRLGIKQEDFTTDNNLDLIPVKKDAKK